ERSSTWSAKPCRSVIFVIAAMRKTAARTNRQPFASAKASRRAETLLSSAVGAGQSVGIPFVPAIGINLGLSQALLMKADGAPEALAAVLGLAIYHDCPCSLQLWLKPGHQLWELLVRHADRAGNVAKLKVDWGTNIDKQRPGVKPKRPGFRHAQEWDARHGG